MTQKLHRRRVRHRILKRIGLLSPLYVSRFYDDPMHQKTVVDSGGPSEATASDEGSSHDARAMLNNSQLEVNSHLEVDCPMNV